MADPWSQVIDALGRNPFVTLFLGMIIAHIASKVINYCANRPLVEAQARTGNCFEVKHVDGVSYDANSDGGTLGSGGSTVVTVAGPKQVSIAPVKKEGGVHMCVLRTPEP